LRRDLVMLGRVATPQRDLLARHIDDILEIPGLQPDSKDYFRDIYDHAIRISDQIDSFRDLLIGSRDAYLSVTSNRLNEISKQLTVVATIFLPLSFIVGFFGQNFGWMVRNINSEAEFWLIGGGSMVVSLVALIVWLRAGGSPCPQTPNSWARRRPPKRRRGRGGKRSVCRWRGRPASVAKANGSSSKPTSK